MGITNGEPAKSETCFYSALSNFLPPAPNASKSMIHGTMHQPACRAQIFLLPVLVARKRKKKDLIYALLHASYPFVANLMRFLNAARIYAKT
jgi:hypothetical protein